MVFLLVWLDRLWHWVCATSNRRRIGILCDVSRLNIRVTFRKLWDFFNLCSCSEHGCWKKDILVPWKEDWAVVAVGLWSILSTAEVVNTCFYLGQATVTNPEIGTPTDCGWIRSGESWKIHWTALPSIAACCQELTKCFCKKDCTKRCKCFRAGLSCTTLCSCMCDH